MEIEIKDYKTAKPLQKVERFDMVLPITGDFITLSTVHGAQIYKVIEREISFITKVVKLFVSEA